MKKIITSFLLLATVSFFGQTFDNLVTINNPSSAYPGININAHDAVNSTPTSHPIIAFNTSGGTDTFKLPISANRALGTLIFSGYDGVTNYQTARIQVNTLSTFSSSNHNARMDFNIGNAYRTRVSIIGQTGNVGIGTTNPQEKLQIGNSGFTFHDGGHKVLSFNPNTSNKGAIRYDLPNKRFTIETIVNGSLKSHMHIANDGRVLVNGNLGIGTTNPDEKLTVKGKIHAEEVRVDLNVPADYVFQQYYTGSSTLKEDYKMPTLEEIEAFTKKNHHLPEVPSAAQIQKEGLHLKEMTNLLLQKIEELTLYTIEQEKRIKALESKLATEK